MPLYRRIFVAIVAYGWPGTAESALPKEKKELIGACGIMIRAYAVAYDLGHEPAAAWSVLFYALSYLSLPSDKYERALNRPSALPRAKES